MTSSTARTRLGQLIRSGELDLPHPGGGHTAERWASLFELARDEDVSAARLAEAHVDAVTILHEAGLEPTEHAAYAVWASVGPGGRDATLDGSTISGTKPFCSGVGIVDRALIDVVVPAGRQLVEVDLTSHSTWSSAGHWGTTALADTATCAITFDDHPVDRLVGGTGWYLARPGFWHGACGPAACWAGAAAGLPARHEPPTDPVPAARFGALLSEVSLLEAVLHHAGSRIDADPENRRAARILALASRAAIHDSCLRLTDQFARLAGPRALVEPDVAQRVADTLLYIRQFHADDDLIALTRSILESHD